MKQELTVTVDGTVVRIAVGTVRRSSVDLYDGPDMATFGPHDPRVKEARDRCHRRALRMADTCRRLGDYEGALMVISRA